MSKNPWKQKVLVYNKKRKTEGTKAADMEIVIRKLSELPPGQLKKLLTDEELCEVLCKYGLEV